MENLLAQSEVESLELRPLWELYEDVEKHILERDGTVKYPTGLTELDRITFGLWKKELLVIAALPGRGKSAFTLNLAKNLADRGEKVVFFSLEMSKEQLVERLITNLLEINNLDLREGVANELLLQRREAFITWAKNVRLIVDDKNGYDLEKITQVIQEIQPDWVIVDYVGMISLRQYGNKTEALDEFTKDIQRISKINNYGTILVSQFNREGQELHNLKGSSTLEHHADTVFLMDWDDSKDIYTIRVAKNRHGGRGKINATFQPQYSKFSDSFAPVIERKDLE